MIVDKQSFDSIIRHFSESDQYGFDSETFGLLWKDRLFSIQLSDEHDNYYFNFLDKPDHLGNLPPEKYILPRAWIIYFQLVFGNRDSRFFIQNAKFDINMLYKEDINFKAQVHCTQAIERLVDNNANGYSLADCAERRGLKKDKTIEEYINKHKLYDVLTFDDKEKETKILYYDLVPFDLMVPYGCVDVDIVRKVGLSQLNSLTEMDKNKPTKCPSVLPLYENECLLTKTFSKMECVGIKIDREYIGNAILYEREEVKKAKKDIEIYGGIPYENTEKYLVTLFDSKGVTYPKTAKGNPSFDKYALENMDNPAANMIKEIRKHEKYLSTYYSAFLYYADADDLIHAHAYQSGTVTGRVSYAEPNLQQVPKEDEDFEKLPYLVRKSFIPREGYVFWMIDYKQQEFCILLDYAGETELIKKVNEGYDVHQATADMLKIGRRQAKTLNFGLLYGMGADTLAKKLDVSRTEAYNLRELYFSKLPKVRQFIIDIKASAKIRGYIFNWFGYRCLVKDIYKEGFRMPNYAIQGSGAQVIKIGTNRVSNFLIDKKVLTRPLVQVHDELLIELHKDELDLQNEMVNIMEGVYKPRNGIQLKCDVSHSYRSWGYGDRIQGAIK